MDHLRRFLTPSEQSRRPRSASTTNTSQEGLGSSTPTSYKSLEGQLLPAPIDTQSKRQIRTLSHLEINIIAPSEDNTGQLSLTTDDRSVRKNSAASAQNDDVFHSARSSPLSHRCSITSDSLPDQAVQDETRFRSVQKFLKGSSGQTSSTGLQAQLVPRKAVPAAGRHEAESAHTSSSQEKKQHDTRSMAFSIVQIGPVVHEAIPSQLDPRDLYTPSRSDLNALVRHNDRQEASGSTLQSEMTSAPTDDNFRFRSPLLEARDHQHVQDFIDFKQHEVPLAFSDDVETDQVTDAALGFDLGAIENDDEAEIPANIAHFLREAAEQYLPKRAGFSSKASLQSHRSQSARPSKRRFSVRRQGEMLNLPGKLKNSSAQDYALQDEDQTSDWGEDYCCHKAKQDSTQQNSANVYCYACELVFCRDCWKKQVAHTKRKLGHDKIEASIGKMMKQTLDVDISEIEQAELHVLDESASWFGAIREPDGVVFRDFGRYASLMAEHTVEERKICYPALVSFVGDTGAGKSSLIKLLVGFNQPRGGESDKLPKQTPVVGNTGAATPTSGDVHLYADAETFFTERPLLYADCEGLRGGTLEPVGAKRRHRFHSGHTNRARTASFEKNYVRRRFDAAEREIAWATTAEKSTRKYFVQNMYPRLLYTFSDVIVFVVKNARAIEDVVEQLIVWADAVIESASNQPVLPQAIIVLNASDNQDVSLWDVDTSTNALFNEISAAVDRNPKLKIFARKWQKCGYHIDSVQSLLLAYYSSIRVIRVPDPKRSLPSLVITQIHKLYEEINNSAKASHDTKHRKRLKLDVERLQIYLQQAFDHFCIDLDDPFDFIKASFANSDIPSDFSGNALKLAVDIMKLWRDRIDGALIFTELSYMMASCLMLHIVRNDQLGPPSEIFKKYLEHVDETLDDFCERIWPCEFITSKGRCVNVRAGHTKGHQSGKGQMVAGEYHSQFSVESHRDKFRNDVYMNLETLLSKLASSANSAEQELAATLHRDTILDPFYRHWGGAQEFISHSACLCCLVSAAEHPLPCGHVLCTSCIRSYGSHRNRNNVIEMTYCPLHRSETNKIRHRIVLKPENAGARLLCLDGGGVRGILMLKVLQRIEQEMGSRLPIESFFDLMIGTSTGGIIALGLIEMGWSVTTCIDKFKSLVSTAFQRHKMFRMEIMDWMIASFQHGLYKTEPLEEMLQKQFSSDRNLFGGFREQGNHGSHNQQPCKVGVTVTSTNGTPYLLANYNRVSKEDVAKYEFYRAEKPDKEIKVWEAARGTAAAPKLFRPYGHAASGHTFVDGGVYYNNPLEVALTEYSLIWPQAKPRLPDLVLSLGTGHAESKKKRIDLLIKPVKTPVSYYKQLVQIAVDHVKHSQKSEEEYNRLRQHYDSSPYAESCFERVNMFFPETLVKPDNIAKLHELMTFADVQLAEKSQQIRRIVDRLIATSFYFDPAPEPLTAETGGGSHFQGWLRCRFPHNSPEMRLFGEVLQRRVQCASVNRARSHHSACFIVETPSCPEKAQQILLSSTFLQSMMDYGQMRTTAISIENFDWNTEVDIHLRFGNEPDLRIHNSISGFPRYVNNKRLIPMTSRLNLSAARARMPSRRGRPEWFQPKTKPDKHLLESYARGQNPGLATDEELNEVQDRLTRARNENTSAEQPWRSTVHLGSTRDLRGYWEPEKIDHWRKLGGQSEPYEMSCMNPHNHPTTQLPHGMQSGEPRSGSTTVGTRPNELDAYPRAEMEGDLYHPRQELNELDTPDEEVYRGRSQHWTPKAT